MTDASTTPIRSSLTEAQRRERLAMGLLGGTPSWFNQAMAAGGTVNFDLLDVPGVRVDFGPNDLSCSPLGYAAAHGTDRQVEALLKAQANPQEGIRRWADAPLPGQPALTLHDAPLALAVEHPIYPLKMASALLEAQADPNTCNAEGVPVLHRALRRGRWGLALRLLETGAEPRAKDLQGNHAWHALMEGLTVMALDGMTRDIIARLWDAQVEAHHPNHAGTTALALEARATGAEATPALPPETKPLLALLTARANAAFFDAVIEDIPVVQTVGRARVRM